MQFQGSSLADMFFIFGICVRGISPILALPSTVHVYSRGVSRYVTVLVYTSECGVSVYSILLKIASIMARL